jgi:hypothetical protein
LTTASGPFAVCHNTTLPATIFSEVTLPFTECIPLLPWPVMATHRYKNCCRGRALEDIINIITTGGEEMIPALTSERYRINSFAYNVYTVLYACPDLHMAFVIFS